MKKQRIAPKMWVCLGGFLSLAFVVLAAQQSSDVAVEGPSKVQVHAQLFSGNSTETIPSVLSRTTGDVEVTSNHEPGLGGEPADAPSYPPYRLVAMSCTSDLVIVGTAESGVSHLTADGAFLYTDWNFLTHDVLKNNLKEPVSGGDSLVVARPGGQLRIKGRNVTAVERNFGAFQSGKQYLLFLEFIPETGAYKAVAEKIFVLSANGPEHLTRSALYPDLEAESVAALVRDTRAAVGAAANNRYCTGTEKSR
jgi:hypothetical protein